MNILVINACLKSADYHKIPKLKTIKETMIYAMCLGFVANGHQVTLAAAEEYRPVVEEKDYDFEVLFFKSDFPRIFLPSVLQLSFAFYKFLKANHQKYDLVLSSEVFMFHSLLASILCPAKTVIWQELTVHQRRYKKIPSKFWHWVIVPLFMRKVRCVIARSEAARLFISKYMKNVSAEIVDHGINADTFEFSTVKKRQVICASQLVYRKNIDRIIAMFNRFTYKIPYEDFKLLIAGEGNYRPYLEEQVRRLHLQDSVVFLGFLSQKELNEKIRESYIFLVSTRQDLNMVSIQEAIVSGAPVLTNLAPASAGYIQKEQLGIAKDDWNEYDMIEMIENNAFYVNNCLRYREKLTSRYCAARIVEIFLGSGRT